jgi:hypothetical protein
VRSPPPKRGRSAAFADPALPAREAHPVWLPTAVGAIAALAAPAGACTDAASITIAALPGLEHILIDAGGRQHVVLRGAGAALQLVISGADVTQGPVTLTLLVRGLAGIAPASAALADLNRILCARPQPAVCEWPAQARRWRDALIALDGRAAGAHYRDIAVVLHGTDYVAENWRLGLRERVRRHLARGLLLSEGGYRDLLG